MKARCTIPPDLFLASDGRLFCPNVRADRPVVRVIELTAREAEVVRTRLADTAGSFLAGLSSLEQPDER